MRIRNLLASSSRLLFAAAVSLAFAAPAALWPHAASAQTTYNVGSTPTGVPFTFLNVKSGQIQGVMVDIIKAVGKEAGFEPKIQAMSFSALIPSLTTGKIDIISAAMFATAKRAQVIDFTHTVYSYGEALFVPASDTNAYKTRQDLKGDVVGAEAGTVFADSLKSSGLFKEVRVYTGISDILRDVSLGRIQAGFGDAPIVKYELTQDKSFHVRLVNTYQPVDIGHIAMAVRKGNTTLLNKINAALAKLEANGTIDAIVAKWGLK